MERRDTGRMGKASQFPGSPLKETTTAYPAVRERKDTILHRKRSLPSWPSPLPLVALYVTPTFVSTKPWILGTSALHRTLPATVGTIR